MHTRNVNGYKLINLIRMRNAFIFTTAFKTQFKIVVYFIAFFCAVEAVNILTGRNLNQFSILPRTFSSLPYILSAPFLHGSIAHFFSNLVTLSIFAFFLMQYGTKTFFKNTLILIIATGLLVWLFARPSYHLGASGLLYAYFAYLLVAGWLQKRILLFVISIFVALFYGSIIFGVLPSQPYISWESHLFGFISGLALAWVQRAK